MLAEGEENHEIACQAPDAVNYIIIWAVNETAIHNEYMGFKVGEQKAVADGMKERSITFVPTADVNRTTLRCVVTDVLNVDNIFPPKECIIIIQGGLSNMPTEYYSNLNLCRHSISPSCGLLYERSVSTVQMECSILS